MAEWFRPQQVIIEIEDNTYTVFLKCFIKSESDFEKLRQSFFQVEQHWRKFAPVSLGGINHPVLAQKRATAPVDWRSSGTGWLTPPPFAAGAAQSPNPKSEIENELKIVREAISELAETIAACDRLLTPYWHARGDIEHRIRLTHGRRPDGAIVFNPDGAAERKPEFDGLLELAIEWGPTRTERAELGLRTKALEYRARRIGQELKYLARKGKKHG